MNPAKLDQKLQSARKFVALKNYPEALALYAQLAKHFPQVGGEYGSAAALSGDYTLADTIWEKFLGHDRNNVEISFRLAAEYQNIGLHARARRILVAAAKTAPRSLEAQLRLASFLSRTSSLEEARAALAACLELNPGHEQVRYLSAHLDRRENKLAEAERQLRELLAAGARNPALVYSCHSELAAIQDRTGNFAGAMARLMEAKALARQNFKFEAERKAFYEQHEQEVRKIISLPKNILTTWAGSFPPGERAPVAPVAFLSGSARSGTTLLEKILDAHPSVAAVDESPAFKVIQSQMDVAMPTTVQKLNFWRQLYGNNLTRTLEENTAGKLFLDKNPSRTVWLPAFLRVFPELRVLIALRDPAM